MATYREPARWNPNRGEMPSYAFLDRKNRRYPYMMYRDEKWVRSEKGLLYAYSRAKQQGDLAIARRAFNMLNEERKKKGKEPLEW